MLKLKLKSNIKISQIKDRYILLNLDNGIYFSINKVGKEICNILSKPTDVNEIFNVLSKTYSINTDALNNDIIEFIDSLKEHELIIME